MESKRPTITIKLKIYETQSTILFYTMNGTLFCKRDININLLLAILILNSAKVDVGNGLLSLNIQGYSNNCLSHTNFLQTQTFDDDKKKYEHKRLPR